MANFDLMATSPAHDFDRRAAQYDAHASVQREAAVWLAEWLPETIDGPALELGAGTGLFTRHLAARTDRLTASDTSPRMIEAGAAALSSVDWRASDASHPPHPQAYRWIFSCSLVQWLPDPTAAFRAWHRVSSPGARLLSGWFVRGTLNEFFAACPEASPFAWRNADEWSGMLAQCGWQTQRSETRSFRRLHANSAAMLREIHNTGAVIPRRFAPGKLRRTLREYDRTHGDETGIWTSFVFFRVEAIRQ